MSRSTLSICIPLYMPNEDHLLALIESVNAIPDEIDVEAVFSFDGQNGMDIERIVALIENAARVKTIIITSSVRLGMVGNWNASIGAASGQFIMLLGQDDVILAENIPLFISEFSERDCSVIFGVENYISDSGLYISDPRKSIGPKDLGLEDVRNFPTGLVTSIGLLYGNVLADPCAAIIRKETFSSAGLFSDLFEHSADIEFWLRVDSLGLKLGRLATPISSRRIHDKNATNTHVSNGIANQNRIDLFKMYSRDQNDHFFNRSLMRLWTHWAYDAATKRTFFEKPGIRFRGGLFAVSRAMAIELLETIRLVSPKREFVRLQKSISGRFGTKS